MLAVTVLTLISGSYNVHHVTFLVWSVSMLTFNGNVIVIPSTMLLGPLKNLI